MSPRMRIVLIILAVLLTLFGLFASAFAQNMEIKDYLNFIDLSLSKVIILLVLGFIGGLVSGFIGSGGAFVLTPGMMSLGVPGLVAVASNMCHKFPKAMVGAYKRYKYGQVDLKLGIIMATFAAFGVLVGIQVQNFINAAWGQAGSDLYISIVYIIVLIIIGGIVFRDAWKLSKSGADEKTGKLALKIQKINLPPMIYFKTANITISLWFIVPIGFATGMLAATIAVGGFIGVPGMMYVAGATALVSSATELVIAFIMGSVGSLKWAFQGLVDIRLSALLLAGSLFGVQLGAIGTTYVKDHVVKAVMGTIMLIVAVSRLLMLPEYLSQIAKPVDGNYFPGLDVASKVFMILALATGAIIILWKIFQGRREDLKAKSQMDYQKDVSSA